MKYNLIFLFVCLTLSFTSAHSQAIDSSGTHKVTIKNIHKPKYQLYKTENAWTFLKLDTSNGKIWQVHFSVTDQGYTGQIILNEINLAFFGDEENGRFALYPTENFYNFILLDQIAGATYQVQWSMDEDNRGVIPIYFEEFQE